jgi:FRG domain
MGFRLDHPPFDTMTKAFLHVFGQCMARGNPRVLDTTPSGLVYPREVPGYVFRGECGQYPTTTASIARVRDCPQLSKSDVERLGQISDWIAARHRADRSDMSLPEAAAQLQHYGMPSTIVDFTGDLGIAFAFAGCGKYSTGRLCAAPYSPYILKLFDHPWAERAQRQAAFGIMMHPTELNDLKADAVRSRLNLQWYEFQITPEEKHCSTEKAFELLREPDDVSAGFIRFYITVYVEAFGKLSPALTEWLLDHVVIAPYCCRVRERNEKDAVVTFEASNALPVFDRAVETHWSRRYWSSDFDDRSERRVEGCVVSEPGSLSTDPRTYHPPI